MPVSQPQGLRLTLATVSRFVRPSDTLDKVVRLNATHSSYSAFVGFGVCFRFMININLNTMKF